MTTGSATEPPLKAWVIGQGIDPPLFERLGDARRLADTIGWRVGAVVAGPETGDTGRLLEHGADAAFILSTAPGPRSFVAAAAAVLKDHDARLVLAPGNPAGCERAALLAVRLGWTLVSPALMVRVVNDFLEVTGLDRRSRMARTVRLEPHRPVIITLRSGVAEALRPDPGRQGEIIRVETARHSEHASSIEILPADPATVDIRYAGRLVAGGRGLGGRTGFDRLRRFAERIGAGVAASRMAVDLGWIDQDRQVGQTGRTVSPDLYIACGISGASHHVEGMSQATHIVAVNTDPEAPIFRVAHLGLVSDLHEVLNRVEEGLKGS